MRADGLPLTATGKIRKLKTREEAVEDLNLVVAAGLQAA